MPSQSKLFEKKGLLWIAAILFCSSLQLQAQSLPGVEVSSTNVDPDAITLVNLASQQFPDLFSGGTPWRQFEGFYFQYFATSGIYLGVNAGDLYLLGGPFGNRAVNQGKISDAVNLLSSGTSSSQVFFDDITAASTLKDLLRYFKTLTISYDTITSAFQVLAAVTLEVQGAENVGGTPAEKLIVTVTGNNLPEPQTYQMWVNSEGVIIKLVQAGGIEFLMPSSDLIGSGLVSGMLLSLASAQSPVVTAAIAEELASPTVSTKTRDANISGIPVKTLAIQVGTEGTPTIVFEISDFGSFSMTSKLESTFAGSTTRFELKNVVLR
ncbi:MAG: hypothetical protein AB8B95_06230 [Pseudohongiellaceae bacterium]